MTSKAGNIFERSEVVLVGRKFIEYSGIIITLRLDMMMPLQKPVYLDNAATSHPKPDVVYRAVDDMLRRGGSARRGSHQRTLSADRLIYATREILCQLFNGCDSSSFIFTPNATTAINMAIFGLLQPGDRVVTTSVGHNAVVRPLRKCRDLGIDVVKVAADPQGIVSAGALQRACLEKPTRLLLINHCSNVTGAIQPLDGLGDWCRQHDIVFMVDGAQSAGSVPIDLEQLKIDLFAAPGHKGLLGPQGTGFLYVRSGISLNPFILGGTGGHSSLDRQPDALPERLEAGTLNVPGIAGLHAALTYLADIGIDSVRARERERVGQIITGLTAIAGVTLYGPGVATGRGSVVSFNLSDRDPAEVGFALDRQFDILTRSGLHCAADVHRTIGTFPGGTVRVSPGHFTSADEITYFLEAVVKLTRH